MLQSHFSLSARDIIIQYDFWTASCTIRNSAALGKKMWFKLVLYNITVYLWSLLPSHTVSVFSLRPFCVYMCMFGCMNALSHMMYKCTQQEFIKEVVPNLNSFKKNKTKHSIEVVAGNINTWKLVMQFCSQITRQWPVAISCVTNECVWCVHLGSTEGRGNTHWQTTQDPHASDLESD